ncbi:MAG: thiamine diphosphokinase [Chloroflexota bacterium]
MILIVANGDLEAGGEWLRPYLQQAEAIVAVDGGLSHLQQLGVMPHYLIGDRDSLTPAQQTAVDQAAVQQITYSPEKDETDLELALLYACAEFGGAELMVAAVLGGRLDQMLANLLLLTHPELQTCSITLRTPYQRAWLLTPATSPGRITGQVDDLVSLLPLGGNVRVAATEGLQWPLHEEVLAFGPARGVSNRLTAVSATVTITSGHLLLVHTDGRWGR